MVLLLLALTAILITTVVSGFSLITLLRKKGDRRVDTITVGRKTIILIIAVNNTALIFLFALAVYLTVLYW